MTLFTPPYHAALTDADYHRIYKTSLQNPRLFWANEALRWVSWYSPWTTVLTGGFDEGEVRWFEGGTLNLSYNCLDRHLPVRAKEIAILWQGDDPKDVRHITYAALHNEVARVGQLLLTLGIQKGDRVCIYLPMIPEAVVAMLACARIGAIHSVVFGGFSPQALSNRIQDANARVLITADAGLRGGKRIPLKENVDEALSEPNNVEHVIVVKRTGQDIPWQSSRDHWYHELLEHTPTGCAPAVMDAEDPLFILYTSGSTGKPKGLVHTTGGYLVYALSTFHHVFNPQKGAKYWCTADIGWITGHTYSVYAPLAAGVTTVIFEGIPTYPRATRLWDIIDDHQINILYTAPTTLRTLMREGDALVKQSRRTSLTLLGTVGEPISPDVWMWYYQVVGEARCPIVDTWWQTETGGILISPMAGMTPLKPGSATRPLFGIEPLLVDANARSFEPNDTQEAALLIAHPWPGLARTVWGDHARYKETYFKPFPGYYFTGDGARRDTEGYYWITGRMDDVINVSGHRLGTADIERALMKHDAVAEAAVVGYPHEIKGQGIHGYIIPMQGVTPTESLTKELQALVRKEIGAIATPDILQWVPGLPKTRSGKIMRRLLRKIAAHDLTQLGDLSTLADPGIVDEIINANL